MSVLSARTTRIVFVSAVICLSLLMCLAVNARKAPTATSRIVKTANMFLSTLNDQQRKSVLFAFNDEKQRARWSNFPTSFVRRAGLNMGELSPTQRSAALALVSSTLSPKGFEKVQQIMDGDEALKTNEGNSMFGKDLYYISFLGRPSEKDPW